MKKNSIIWWVSGFSILIAFTLVTTSQAQKQLSYPGCPDLTFADFEEKMLAIGSQILELDVANDGSVYFAERNGRVQVYTPWDKKTTHLFTVDVNTARGEAGASGNALSAAHRGLVGLVLDPDFDKNGRFFLTYHAKERDPETGHPWYRVSRFTMKGQEISTSEQIIIQFPYILAGEHTAGSLRFDKQGRLYITTGSNANSKCKVTVWEDPNIPQCNAFRTSSNTNNLHGKILRIIPIPFSENETLEPGIGQTYTIPLGNLADSLAEEMHWTVADLEKIRPEIWSMGHRQPYSMEIDPKTGWVTICEDGPGKLTDEWNLIKGPGNFGWPLVLGVDLAMNSWDPVAKKVTGPLFDLTAPKNTSMFNTGIVDLPPLKPSVMTQKRPIQNPHPVPGFQNSLQSQTPISGPIYNYNGNNRNSKKLPPHLDRMWISGEYYQKWLRALEINETGDSILYSYDILDPGTVTSENIDMKMGPDGSLYFVSYNNSPGKIIRLEYKGDCLPAEPVWNWAKTINIVEPNGLGDWTNSTQKRITWHSTGGISNVVIEYAVVDEIEEYQIVAAGVPNTGIYMWTLPQDFTDKVVKIRVSEGTVANIKVVKVGEVNPNVLDVNVNPVVERPATIDRPAGAMKNGIFEITRVQVVDIQGKVINDLVANTDEFIWDRMDEEGRAVPTGLYIIMISGSDRLIYRKVFVR